MFQSTDFREEEVLGYTSKLVLLGDTTGAIVSHSSPCNEHLRDVQGGGVDIYNYLPPLKVSS